MSIILSSASSYLSDQTYDEDADVSDNNTGGPKSKRTCSRLKPGTNKPYYLMEPKRERKIEQIDCSEELLEKVCGNYVIVTQILRGLRWQDKLICRSVCSMWDMIVQALAREQSAPVDFSIDLPTRGSMGDVILKRSQQFITEPLAVLVFCNSTALRVYNIGCNRILPGPRRSRCRMQHSIFDIIFQALIAPKTCMYSAVSYDVAYLPLPGSETYKDLMKTPLKGAGILMFGVSIPVIPGVEFKTIDLKKSEGLPNELKTEVGKILEKYTLKGAMAYLTDNYLLYANQETAECLEFLSIIQPDTPFAFGGCLTEDTVTSEEDMKKVVEEDIRNTIVSGNLVSFSMFLVPKDEEPQANFEMFSLVITSTEWSKAKIQQVVKEFSQRVPRYEHSVAVKLSCMGRMTKHDTEQNAYREFFPNTRIVGCFGNGELGVDWPPRNVNKRSDLRSQKRPRGNMVYERVYSYSTVFLHICWGRLLAKAERDE